MPRFARTVLPHLILVVFSLMILMPLLWILRVSFTDKLTAYKIPPEIGTVGLMNYVDIFARYPFTMLVRKQPHRRLGRNRDLAAARDRSWPMPSRASIPAARACAWACSASQMLPPIILVLPLFGMFLVAGLMQSRAASSSRISPSRCRSSPG